MGKIEVLKTKTAEKLIKDFIQKDAVLQTDDSSTNAKFEDFVDVNLAKISSAKEGKFNLKWTPTANSNLKVDLKIFDMQ